MSSGPTVPPRVDVDIRSSTLREYWLARAAQHTQDTYAGLPLSKFPEDLRVYEHLLWAAAPDTIVEIGTQYGGSALWFRDRLRTLRDHGRISAVRVVSLDLHQSAAGDLLETVDRDYADEIALVEGDVRSAATIEAVRRAVPAGARCMVVEDGAHQYDTTLAALDGLAELVAPGSFLMVEDGCVDVEELRLSDSWPRGVLPALEHWMAHGGAASFVRRPDLQPYGITCHPAGLLQRTG